MASCNRIDSMVQAYIDGELKPSQKVLIEEHVSSCASCARRMRSHQRCTVALIEALAPSRLDQSLRRMVLEHLPEMEPAPDEDMAGVNWRAKHQETLISRTMRWLPLLAAVLLAVIAFVIKQNWPETGIPTASTVGMVTYATGSARITKSADADDQAVREKTYVNVGGKFATHAESRVMLSLLGNTQVKLNENSVLAVQDERELTLETGEAWLHVGKDKRRFVVHTPVGDVTVMGTVFAVKTDGGERMSVTVTEGEVHVVREGAAGHFAVVRAGEEVVIERAISAVPKPGRAESGSGWAENMTPRPELLRLFQASMFPRQAAIEMPGVQVYRISAFAEGQKRRIGYIEVQWTLPSGMVNLCDYEVFIYDANMQPLFRDRVELNTLGLRGITSFQLAIPEGPASRAEVLNLRFVPDYHNGETQSPLTVKGYGW